LESSSKFLFLASGVKSDEGFWFVGIKSSNENILDDQNLLDCHRKELLGKESARDILLAINLNLNNIIDELKKKKYSIDRPSIGFSFNIPLDVLEKIFDFWLDIYKDKEAWETCIGLLKIRKKVSLLNLIESGSLKGNSKKWAIEVETLHTYIPNSRKNNYKNEPMWK
tara:strand:- start:75 stop:578 length:504 start_codon:yes stop_codon:yes gene_type:complete